MSSKQAASEMASTCAGIVEQTDSTQRRSGIICTALAVQCAEENTQQTSSMRGLSPIPHAIATATMNGDTML
jgi:hypothetical protein